MRALRTLTTVVVLGTWATGAYGDGGAMLLHQDAGPFTITLFAAPRPLQVGAADLSVMVQDRDSGDVLLDPAIDITVTSETDAQKQETVRLAPGPGSNRLLQAADAHFPSAGKWSLAVVVRRGNDVARVSVECNVEPDSSRARLVWFYIMLPVGVILLFIIHQGLKLRSEVSA